MDWQLLLRDWGVPTPAVTNIGVVLASVLSIAAIYGIGWYSGRRIRKPLSNWINRLGGRLASSTVSALIRYALAALLLLVACRIVRPNDVALLLFAGALGLATGLFLFHAGKIFGFGRISSFVLAILGFGAAFAATLGGMARVTTSLDSIAFAVGDHRLSLLMLFNAAITVGILVVVARLANRVFVQMIGRTRGFDPSQRLLFQKLAGICVIVVAVLLGIDLLGIDLTALAVFSGALGLAVGFGLQKTLGNLIAGLILLMDRSIKPGDVIVVGDTFGAVNKIGVRAVSVVTRDGKEHLIPNEQLMTQSVENWSYSSRNVRLRITVGVSYRSDLATAQRLMIEAATAAQRVLADPRPTVWLKEFGENAVIHDILVWIADPEMGVGNVQSDILTRLWHSFAEHGIELPLRQQDVHIRNLPAAREAGFVPPPESG
ncbi:MAG: mechanosensitive ion channel [Sphingomonadales bacterium]|nr:MAG: mechanosensitive ion channel [Sphingomonadales bacterium]